MKNFTTARKDRRRENAHSEKRESKKRGLVITRRTALNEYQILCSHITSIWYLNLACVWGRRVHFNLICWIFTIKALIPFCRVHTEFSAIKFFYRYFPHGMCFFHCAQFYACGQLFLYTKLLHVKRMKENVNICMTPFTNKYIQFWFHKLYFMQSLITLEQFPTFLSHPRGLFFTAFGFWLHSIHVSICCVCMFLSIRFTFCLCVCISVSRDTQDGGRVRECEWVSKFRRNEPKKEWIIKLWLWDY